ncbi:MAG: hypothetical protein RKL32_20335, partial [Gammaproteobacteria bacterium]
MKRRCDTLRPARRRRSDVAALLFAAATWSTHATDFPAPSPVRPGAVRPAAIGTLPGTGPVAAALP